MCRTLRLYRIDYDEECIIVERKNRFVVRVLVNGKTNYAYICNTGRLKEIIVRGKIGYCKRRARNLGKTRYRLFAVEDHGLAALVDTMLQEEAFTYMINNSLIPWLRGCSMLKRNIRVNESVLDYLLTCDKDTVYVELKSAVLRGSKDMAMYPDCPTYRGRRHITKLMQLAEQGYNTILVFIAALPKIKAFTLNKDVDKIVYDLVKKAIEKGVVVKAIGIHYDPIEKTLVLDNPDLPIRL